MHSERFQKPIRLTHHVQRRMDKREVSIERLLDLIDTGELTWKNTQDAWIHKHYPDRTDNRLCAAVLIGQAVIVKTVMVDWQPVEDAP